MIFNANLAQCRAYFILLALLPLPLLAAPLASSPLIQQPAPVAAGNNPERVLTAGDQQLIHQQEQQRALEQRLTPNAPDVRLSPPSDTFGRIVFPQETPCFTISQVTLSGTAPPAALAAVAAHQ